MEHKAQCDSFQETRELAIYISLPIRSALETVFRSVHFPALLVGWTEVIMPVVAHECH